jgi:hypothetical protein
MDREGDLEEIAATASCKTKILDHISSKRNEAEGVPS